MEIFNEHKIILDLCGGTGSWSKPYREAGYKVIIIDIKNGDDVRLFRYPEYQVHGVLAAPLCTCFAGCGARWKRTDDDYREGLSVADACIRIAVMTNCKWWVVENPVGKLGWWYGRPVMYFQPHYFGDQYTKRTGLWGKFNKPVVKYKKYVDPTEGSKMHKKYGGRSDKTKVARSITPQGFAKAFFEANP